jgi:hypothetical protein
MSDPGQVGFPQLDSHFVDEDRNILWHWYKLLVALWQLAGSGTIPIFQAVFLRQTPPGNVNVYDTSLKGLIGAIRLKNRPGLPEVHQTPVTSPFVFTAPGDGTFTAFCCEIELARSAGFVPLTLTGGAVPMMKDDVVRLSWVGGSLPTAVWWPSG